MSYYLMSIHETAEHILSAFYGSREISTGCFLVDFLETDWQGLKKESESLRDACVETRSLSFRFYYWFRKLGSKVANYPLFSDFLRCQLRDEMQKILEALPNPDGGAEEYEYLNSLYDHSHFIKAPVEIADEYIRLFLNKIAYFFAAYSHMKEQLLPAVDYVMGNRNEFAFKTYYRYRRSHNEYTVLSKAAYSKISPVFQVSVGGRRENFEETASSDADINAEYYANFIDSYTYMATDHLEALALWEFDMLCSMGLRIRRCELCGRFFLPYSSVSAYCDRPAPGKENKTCKEVGAMLKHQKNVAGDAPKLLYRKVSNRVHLAAKRMEPQHPNIITENYTCWIADAKELLKKVENGEISFKEYEGLIDRSPKELLGIKDE